MDKKRIAVLVSGGGTNLQALIDAQKSGTISSGEITLVVSSVPDAYALTRAASNSIESVVVSRKAYATREEFSDALAQVLIEKGCDLIVFAGFMCILSEGFIKRFEGRMMNVHPTLIPAFCGDGYYGIKVHQKVLERGVKLTGATVHFVNEITDGGPIILQKAVDVLEGDTPEVLQKRVMVQAEWELLPRAAELFCSGRLSIRDGRVHIDQ
ncbi:MAG: phosphoribosylglycinamide formyltransferase [Eubacteriales bacterium]